MCFVEGGGNKTKILQPEKVIHHFKFLSLLFFSIKCKVVGKKFNRREDYGLEVLMDFIFYENNRAIKRAEKRITLIIGGQR